MRPSEPQNQSGRCEVEKNLLPIPGIKPRPSNPSLYGLSYSGFRKRIKLMKFFFFNPLLFASTNFDILDLINYSYWPRIGRSGVLQKLIFPHLFEFPGLYGIRRFISLLTRSLCWPFPDSDKSSPSLHLLFIHFQFKYVGLVSEVFLLSTNIKVNKNTIYS
jgi:hypothetical protein